MHEDARVSMGVWGDWVCEELSRGWVCEGLSGAGYVRGLGMWGSIVGLGTWGSVMGLGMWGSTVCSGYLPSVQISTEKWRPLSRVTEDFHHCSCAISWLDRELWISLATNRQHSQYPCDFGHPRAIITVWFGNISEHFPMEKSSNLVITS